MDSIVIGPDSPDADDVADLLGRHLQFSLATTPPAFVFALDAAGLAAPDITLCSARVDGRLLGVGALKELDPEHGELKSIHTTVEARGRGVATAMVHHLLALARSRDYRRVSLETGSGPAFAPARALYARAGFTVCGPFAAYPDSANSVFMTCQL